MHLLNRFRSAVVLLTVLGAFSFTNISAQDTVEVQTLTWDSAGRDYVFTFPDVPSETYEKIIMLYNMRCKNALVSSSPAPNDVGCGEWDYSCNTYITDSSKTDSLMATHPDHVISDFGGTSFDFSNNPTYTFYSTNQYNVSYSDTISQTIGTVGTPGSSDSVMFDNFSDRARNQYLFTATELTAAGITAGDISALQMEIFLNTTNIPYLRINLKHTNRSTLSTDSLELEGFTNVYYANTTIVAPGEHEFRFYNNFTWDGTSNLIVEFTYEKPTGPGWMNFEIDGAYPTNMAIRSQSKSSTFQPDSCIEFGGGQYIELNSPMPSISNEITVSFWAYGDTAYMPANTSVFEGVDASGTREANVHLPWSNGRVYWDCGNVGTYDRIDKAANTEDLEGKWNHWAFTKNATTGNMSIYLNGQLWHSGTGNTNPIDLHRLNIGASGSGSNFWAGKLDEFRVWSTALSQSEIYTWMHKSITPAHPNYSSLVTYHQLEGGTSTTSADALGFANGSFVGLPVWRAKKGNELFMNFEDLTVRPLMDFVQGTYTTIIDTVSVLDSLINVANTVDEYSVVGTDLNLDNSYQTYEAGDMPIYDESGNVIGVVNYPVDGTITITDLDYYNKFPMKFEIMSLVTPYGIGLDLGPEGKTFTFDVTDFTPILKGPKRMTMERGGQNQEEMDIKFLFIKGTPPRDVIDIQQIWPVRSNSYTSIMADDVYEPRMVATNATASMWDIRTVITGHGAQGEFIPRNHYVNADGGSNELDWQVWKECAGNPIPAQGGTWVYDRAGWCPGMESDLQRTDITSLITPGNVISIDYGVTAGSGDSRYIVNNQLVTYGPANFSLDAHLVDVVKPSKKVEHEKFNPICSQPVVVIQNTGSTTLTSLTIDYSVRGGAVETFNWTGSLDFLETEEVTLPISAPAFWTSSPDSVFVATCSAPNGGTDGYSDNNSFESEFTQYPVYSGQFIIQHRLNTHYFSNSFEIYDETGAVVYEQFGRPAGTYADTLLLAAGCYKIKYIDTVSVLDPNSGNDGLSWWANPAQGSGYFRLRVGGTYELIANPDFGSFFEHSFYVSNANAVGEEDITRTLAVFPNPTTDLLNVNFYGFENDQIDVEVINESGKLILKEKFSNDKMNLNRKEIPTSDFSPGVYFIKLIDKDVVKVSKFMKH